VLTLGGPDRSPPPEDSRTADVRSVTATARIVLQMSVALSGSGSTMSEHLADEIDAVFTRHRDRGEAGRTGSEGRPAKGRDDGPPNFPPNSLLLRGIRRDGQAAQWP
jgi:hypothetical protein